MDRDTVQTFATTLHDMGERLKGALSHPMMNESTLLELDLIELGRMAEDAGIFRHLLKGREYAQDEPSYRTCDECDRRQPLDEGGPDWPDGVCDECDPSILTITEV